MNRYTNHRAKQRVGIHISPHPQRTTLARNDHQGIASTTLIETNRSTVAVTSHSAAPTPTRHLSRSASCSHHMRPPHQVLVSPTAVPPSPYITTPPLHLALPH